MSLVVVMALLGTLSLEPVGAGATAGPDPSLVGIWLISSSCAGSGCGAVLTLTIGGKAQEAIDPLCTPDVYCLTTPNTSSMGGIFFAEDISLTANGSGSWTWVCKGCLGWENIKGHFTGNSQFTGTAISEPAQPGAQPVPYNGYKTGRSLPPSVALSISPQSSTLAIGEKLNVTLTAKAGPTKLTNVDLYHGLDLSPTGSAEVSQAPPGINGFALAAFASRKFVFRLTGVKAGTVKITAFATASSTPGATHGSAEAQLTVGDVSDYTINMQASIPQGIIVDPSSAARYNTTSDNGAEGYNTETPFLKALIGTELEYPECLSAQEVQEDTEKGLRAEWYSYWLGGNSLGKIKIPLQWDESSRDVTLLDGVSTTTYNLTRVFKYRLSHATVKAGGKGGNVPTFAFSGPSEECEESVPVKMLVAPVAGGDDLEMAPGLPVNEFSIVAAWEFPGSPAGARVNPEPSLVEFLVKKVTPYLEALFGPSVVSLFHSVSEANEVYEKNTPAVIKFLIEFGISYLLATGAVAAVGKAPAVIAKANTYLGKAVQLSAETLAWIKEYAGVAHSGAEVWHTTKALNEILEGLEQLEGYLDRVGGAYPIMSAVVRGKFSTEYGSGPDAGAPQKTLLGVSVQTTKFPNIWLTVTRTTQSAATGSSVHPFNGELPWDGQAGGQVTVHNPFGANPTGLINDSMSEEHSYLSGEEAVDELVHNTGQNPAVDAGIRNTANLDSDFAAEESEAAEPLCNSDGEDPTGSESTICWLIHDGSGPNDHRA
jgi:hypothetical protein